MDYKGLMLHEALKRRKIEIEGIQNVTGQKKSMGYCTKEVTRERITSNIVWLSKFCLRVLTCSRKSQNLNPCRNGPSSGNRSW